MKHIYLIILIVFPLIISIEVNSDFRGVDSDKNVSRNNLKSSDLIGIWIFSDYIDSTIKNKTIYEYSGGFTSTAYALKIEKLDNCSMMGFHENVELPLLNKIDSGALYGFDMTQYFEFKLLNSDLLTVQEIADSNYFKSYRPDSRPYYYRRAAKLPPDNLKQYFIDKIFKGKYVDLKNNKSVTFTSDRKILNHDLWSEYDIVIDFWENSVGNFDMIYLTDGEMGNTDNLYNWNFNGDTLIIKQLKGEFDENSGLYHANPDKVITRLKKIN